MYQKAYYMVFNSITDALSEMDKMNVGLAKQTLIAAQQAAEELFLQDADKHNAPSAVPPFCCLSD